MKLQPFFYKNMKFTVITEHIDIYNIVRKVLLNENPIIYIFAPRNTSITDFSIKALEFYRKGCKDVILCTGNENEKNVFAKNRERGFNVAYVRNLTNIIAIHNKHIDFIYRNSLKFNNLNELTEMLFKRGCSLINIY